MNHNKFWLIQHKSGRFFTGGTTGDGEAPAWTAADRYAMRFSSADEAEKKGFLKILKDLPVKVVGPFITIESDIVDGLLEACEWMTAILSEPEMVARWTEEKRTCVEAAREAIAKARGETS